MVNSTQSVGIFLKSVDLSVVEDGGNGTSPRRRATMKPFLEEVGNESDYLLAGST